MTKHSYHFVAVFFLLLLVTASRSFGQSQSTPVPQHNPINVIVDGLSHETPDFTLLRQNLETILKVRVYATYGSDFSSLDFLCDKTPTEIWDKLPQDTKDRFKLIRLEPARIDLATKDAGTNPGTSQLSDRAKDEQAIAEAVQLFQAALLNNNAKAAAPLLSGDFVFNAYGKKMNKEERLASINSGLYKYGPFKKEDVKVTLYPNTASVVITTPVKYKNGDNDISVNFSTLTFTKKDAHWLLSGECLLGEGCNK